MTTCATCGQPPVAQGTRPKERNLLAIIFVALPNDIKRPDVVHLRSPAKALGEAAVFRDLQEGPSSWLNRAVRDTPSGILLVEESSELLP